MDTPRTHEITLEGVVRCLDEPLLGALRTARKTGERLYVTWRPDEVTCLACQAAAARAVA